MSDDEKQTEQSFALRIVESVGDFSEDEWNHLAGTSRQDGNYNRLFPAHFFWRWNNQAPCHNRLAGCLTISASRTIRGILSGQFPIT